MSETTELVELPAKESALAVYSADKGLEPFLAKIRAEIDAFTPTVATKKGRDAIASIAHKVAKSKVALDNIGKDLVADLKDLPRKVDAERKRMRDTLDNWRDEVRQPLTEWEEAEEARIARHKLSVELMWQAAEGINDFTAYTLRTTIVGLEAVVVDASLEEFEAEAHRVKAAALEALKAALAAREKHEAEQAELAKLRAEAEARRIQDEKDRIAREAAERATKEAEAKAQAERDAVAKREADAKAAADRRELELKLQAETAERQKLEAEQKAEKDKADAIARAEQEKRDAEERQRQAVEDERKRQADEAARVEAEAKTREADVAHKSGVLRKAKEAIMKAGITEDQARAVIKMIGAGKVPCIYIEY